MTHVQCMTDECDCIDWRITQAGRELFGMEDSSDALMFIYGLAVALRHPEWAQAVVIDHKERYEYEDPDDSRAFDQVVEQVPVEVEVGTP